MPSLLGLSLARGLAAWALFASVACDAARSGSAPDVPAESVPARVVLELSPPAALFVVGTSGQLTARAFSPTGEEIVWSAPRRLEASDPSVLSVDANGLVLARRVGFSWLRALWAGRVMVGDSVHVRVGVRGVGTMRYYSFESGCWFIVTDPVTAYRPPNLPNAFKLDGLRVRFAGRPLGGGDFCLAGIPIELDSIRLEVP